MPPLIDCKAIDCRAARHALELADIFRSHGPAYRRANAGHVSLSQLKVISAIEACRTEGLGGHVAACTKCDHQHIAYNSCKTRHCPKCQGPAARDWMEARAEDLLPVEYFHVVSRTRPWHDVFTLPAEIAHIAYWNKRTVYGLLFKASAETVATIAADPKRMGARVGMTSVLHTSHQRCVSIMFEARLWRGGLGHDASPTHPHDRAGWWALTRRFSLGCLQAMLLSPCAGVIAIIPQAVH